MRIRWTPSAADDLENISDYLLEQYPHLAEETVLRLYVGIQSLKNFPRRGRPGPRSGVRELILTPLPYIVLYSVSDEAVEVLRIYHGSQERRQ